MSAEWGPDPVRVGSLTAFCEVFPGFGFSDDHQILDVAAQLAADQLSALWTWSGPACAKDLVDSQLQKSTG
jgi:hypothetical protein